MPSLDILASVAAAERTREGKVVLYHIASGRKYERAEDSAADMLASGEFRITKDAPAPAPEPVVARRKGAK